MSKILIQGATEPPRQAGIDAPSRLEIATFVKPANIRQFSLYIQVLQRMYERQSNDPLSYYQISGIHGMPYVDWNHSPSENDQGQKKGYCIHRSSVFGSWHRPYMALLDQELQRVAVEIAQDYRNLPDAQDWLDAAHNLRQPYWGWDEEETYIPPKELTHSHEVEIILRSGEQVPVPNPFLGYKFQPGETDAFPDQVGDKDFTKYKTPHTLRHPKDGNSQPDKLVDELKARQAKILGDTERLYRLDTWANFMKGSDGTDGLEAIHGSIHVAFGGIAGHFGEVEVSAFDPVVYLHHAQVDRIVQYWYDLHGIWETDPKDLRPFWRTGDTYWQSPGLEHPDANFNYFYAPRSFPLPGPPPPQPGQDISVEEWGVLIHCKQFDVGGSFSVFVFFGPVPDNTDEWLTHETCVGVFDVFANASPEECPNCTAQRNKILQGVVHIDDALAGVLKVLDEVKDEVEGIVSFLTDNLSWGVLSINDGERVDLGTFPSLEMTVERTEVITRVGANYPEEGKTQFYDEVTRGKAGGSIERTVE